jgi:hypothetical protein
VAELLDRREGKKRIAAGAGLERAHAAGGKEGGGEGEGCSDTGAEHGQEGHNDWGGNAIHTAQ